MQIRTMPLKFRVWDDVEKSWGAIPSHQIGIALSLLRGEANKEDDRYIISQDTGLKDENGKSIYTGDILEKRYSNDNPFNGVRAVCYYEDGNVDFECVIGNDNVEGFLEEYSIVGNLWQNAELLGYNGE